MMFHVKHSLRIILIVGAKPPIIYHRCIVEVALYDALGYEISVFNIIEVQRLARGCHAAPPRAKAAIEKRAIEAAHTLYAEFPIVRNDIIGALGGILTRFCKGCFVAALARAAIYYRLVIEPSGFSPKARVHLLRDVRTAFEVARAYCNESVKMRMICIISKVMRDLERPHTALPGGANPAALRQALPCSEHGVKRAGELVPTHILYCKGTKYVSVFYAFRQVRTNVCGLSVYLQAATPHAHGAKSNSTEISRDELFTAILADGKAEVLRTAAYTKSFPLIV